MSDDEGPASVEPAPADAAAADRIPDETPKQTRLWIVLSRWLLALEAWLRSHGGNRLRGALLGFWALVAAAGAVLLVGPVINPPLTLDEITSSAETATETWIARQFDTDYRLSRDDQGRLQAEVTETITAFFPDDVDESGIRRMLPAEYQGHALGPTDLHVTVDGESLERVIQSTPTRLTLDLDTGTRLRGDHVFVVSYRLHDLAYATADTVTGGDVDLLQWSVFGPDFAQGLGGLSVQVSMPDDLAGQLVREPRGAVGWLLVAGGQWLQPEADHPAGTTVYSFETDQNLPPYSQAWFTMPFAPGTFAMPGPTPWFIVQTFGPLLPLLVLVVTLLFTFAARAVAWSDARGRPWFVAQYDPPARVQPAMAAQLLRTPRTRELALAVAGLAHNRSTAGLATAARAARRTGRVGDRLRAALAFRADPAHRAQQKAGYRRVPRGFVRDWFLAAPPALALLQLGLVRQLSHQESLAVVWWPAVFVLASLVIGVIVWGVTLSAVPLTRSGALVKQYLRGIDVYARRTQLLDRATLSDRLLPYAILSAEPRHAARAVTALVQRERGDRDLEREWRTDDFLTWPRLFARWGAAVVIAGVVAIMVFAHNPYTQTSSYDDWQTSDGARYLQTSDVSIDADLALADGEPQLTATERIRVAVDDDPPIVPQFARKWATSVDGQDIGFAVTAVRMDGDAVPFSTASADGRLTMTTTMSRVIDGEHTFEVDYRIAHPVTAGRGSALSGHEGAQVDRIRWSALLDGWDTGWSYPSKPDIALSVTVADPIADRALAAGWLRRDPTDSDDPAAWAATVFPFGTIEDALAPSAASDDPGTITETASGGADGTDHRMSTTPGEYGYPASRVYDDLGAQWEFPTGTYALADAGGLTVSEVSQWLPIALVWTTAGVSLLIAAASVVSAVRRGRPTRAGAFRDAAWFLGPACGVAALLAFGWASASMSTDERPFPALIIGAGVALACFWVPWAVLRPRRGR